MNSQSPAEKEWKKKRTFEENIKNKELFVNTKKGGIKRSNGPNFNPSKRFLEGKQYSNKNTNN